MFAVKNRMTDISSNFSSNKEIEKCWCGENQNMEHIYMCTILNNETTEMPYKKLFNGNINEQIVEYKRFINNMSEREKRKTKMKKKIFPMRSLIGSHSPLV